MVSVLANKPHRAKCLFAECLTTQCSQFRFDEDNKALIGDIFQWCMRDFDGKLDPAKGLWLCGTVGSGKSTIMRAVLAFASKYWQWADGEKFFPEWMNASKYCGRYAVNGFDVFENIPMAIDELGAEIIPSSYMGNKLNVMEYMFHELDDSTHGIPRIITTNCRLPEIAMRYGAYTIDRIGRLYNIVEVLGHTRRDSASVWTQLEKESVNVGNQVK